MALSSRVKNISASLTLAITAKAKKMKEQGIDVIGFGSGEPDFDTPAHIKEAGIKAIQQGLTKYTPASGTDTLKEIICEKFSKDNGLSYDPSQIVVSCGAKHSLYNIFQAICEKGDEVAIPSPYWLSYPEMVKLAEAEPRFVDADDTDNFKISPVKLKKAITKKTKALIINSPSNPTGSVYDKDELAEIGKMAADKNIFIISDEIYEKIIFDGKPHVSIASISDDIFKNTIVVNGVSKSFSMTGWRIGYIASVNKEIVSAIKNLQSHSTSNPTSISQAAALEAIKVKDNSVETMVKEFERRRNYIVERVNSIEGLSCVKPGGAFYIFCRIDNKGLSSISLSDALLEDAKVAVVPGKPFGSDQHIRLSFATSMENIQKGMDRIEEWFKEHGR
ncbi:MAG: pyridoxal phosphate-dependent aminotransferase [Candidatus Omnitrophica bacterium]|nr:pyridoxal phosphate-dependent aminotransferase [Candidatus Omnitrophota bacterium]MBU4589376.1 pyridoxal phosphate-dependent aminotransferase [Candidatus Omnitrophota bacterium]